MIVTGPRHPVFLAENPQYTILYCNYNTTLAFNVNKLTVIKKKKRKERGRIEHNTSYPYNASQ